MSQFEINTLFDVKGKIVLITGGTRGIGLMMARGFVANGAKVYISSRTASVCQEVSRELSEIVFCKAIQADLSSKEGRLALLDQFRACESRLDVLINNAGAAWGATIQEHSEEAYDKVMDLNLKAMFFLSRDLIPVLSNNTVGDPSRIINIGSIDGMVVPGHDNPIYSISKVAVHQLTKILAAKISGLGITVNAIAPGPFESKMTAFMLTKAQREIELANPLKRIGIPEDMAGIALFLSSKAASYINGVVIPVDGGLHLKSYQFI